LVAAIESDILSISLVKVELEVFLGINAAIKHCGSLHLSVFVSFVFVDHSLVVFEESHAGLMSSNHFVFFSIASFFNHLAIFCIQESALLFCEVSQVFRQNFVLALDRVLVEDNSVTSKAIECVDDDQKVATADLVFETAHTLQFYKNSLWHFLLSCIELLHPLPPDRI